MINHYAGVAGVTTLLSTAALLVAFASNPEIQVSARKQAQPATPVASQSPAVCPKLQGGPKLRRAYHKDPPDHLPLTLDAAQFKDRKAAFVAYSIAVKIRALLYQEPCFCPCDTSENHQSLLDCFTSEHAITCHVCQAEAIFAYEESKSGKTASQIRDAMHAPALAKIDVGKYAEAHYSDFESTAP
jgi:hypothetical protein